MLDSLPRKTWQPPKPGHNHHNYFPASPASAPASGSSGNTAAADVKTLLEARCTVCHDLGRVEAKKATAYEWKAITERMIQNGAKLTTEEQTILIQYPAETHK